MYIYINKGIYIYIGRYSLLVFPIDIPYYQNPKMEIGVYTSILINFQQFSVFFIQTTIFSE